MAVQLEAIKLNHDPSSATTDALNVRKDGTTFVSVPEWVKGVSNNPEDSPACYAISETAGHTLTIQAKFSTTGEPARVEIRAVDPHMNPPGPSGCMAVIAWLIRKLLWSLFGNVLGEAKARSVSFGANGESAFETFELEHVRLWSVGVGTRTTEWRWQYRTSSSGPWTDFATSSHRIYVVLAVPSAPWQQTPYQPSNLQLPWTKALDFACRWATFATNADDAATGVTNNVFGLGPGTVTYDCPGGGSSHYSWGSCDLTAFIERLEGGTGNGYYVNCSDCATFVSTFANLVGCDLWQSRMGWSFGLNPMLGIGSNVWQPCCGWSGFSYHEVAWKGACGVDDNVFDACLQVDGDADPTAAPHTAQLVANMRFGNTGDGDYRDRLATPGGRPNCNPQPGTKKRRVII